MHTNEIVHDTFIPRWFGRLGNNIQQISNGIYYCRKNGIRFTSPDHPLIHPIDIDFGSNEFKIKDSSHNWFYFYEGPDADFQVDVAELNFQRKKICEEYILPKLKINHADLEQPLDHYSLVAHIRSGDVYSYSSHPAYVQNPLKFYLDLYESFNGKVIFVTEDDNSIITKALRASNIQVNVLDVEQSLTLMLRAKAVATSGVGTFALSAVFCSKNINRIYCTNLWLPNALNPQMLKEHLDVYSADIDDNKYIKVGEWKHSSEALNKVISYNELISFRRL
jgi:hypothetical protein